MAKKNTFEASMKKLEEIVLQLERGDISLEESISLFEEGTKISKILNKQLSEAEQKVSLMIENTDGSLSEIEFETEGAE